MLKISWLLQRLHNNQEVQEAAPNAQLLVVDSVVTTPEYDKLIARMHK